MESDEKSDAKGGACDPQVIKLQRFLSALTKLLPASPDIKQEVQLHLVDEPGATSPGTGAQIRHIQIQVRILAVTLSARVVGAVRVLAENCGFSKVDMLGVLANHELKPLVAIQIDGNFNKVDTYHDGNPDQAGDWMGRGFVIEVNTAKDETTGKLRDVKSVEGDIRKVFQASLNRAMKPKKAGKR